MRSVKKLLFASALVAVALVPAAGQTVEEIVRRHVEALGGRQVLDGVKDVRMTGTARVPGGSPMPILIEWKRPNRYRLELRVRERRGVQGYNGKSAWEMTLNGDLLSELRMAPETVANIRRLAEDFLGSLTNLRNKTVRVEGAGSLDGRGIVQLRVSYSDGTEVTESLDSGTFLPVQIETVSRIAGVDYPSVTELSDYRRVGGIPFALQIRSRPKTAAAALDIKIQDIWLDTGIPDDHFDRP
jgi:hypothetical protein